MAAYRVGEIEALLTVNDKDVARAEKNIKATGERIEKNPVTKKVDADVAGAVAGMDRVEKTAKQLVSQKTALVVEARIDQAEKNVERISGRLEYLRAVSTTMDVTADISRAEASLKRATRLKDALEGARATMVVDVDAADAEKQLGDLADSAEEAGEDGGKRGGAALLTGIVAGLASIPIVGAIAKIAETAASTLVDEFNDALQIDVRQDRLQALTGISEDSAAKFARAAGEAYADNFGESVESNMNVARLALQFDLIDEDATTRDAQKVVEGLGGIADILEEDVTRPATAVTTLLRTGLAKSATDAFDLIAAGAAKGLNRNEDLLDTLTEYPVVLARLGLTGQEMLGLISQGMQAGARNTDVAADALKEFQIRATDGSTLSAQGFERLGFSAQEMTAKIAAGGAGAREGLAQVLDGLRAIEDPVARNAAAVELFGTKAEDLGDALFAMDLSTAASQLDTVAGAADRMFSTISDNDASRIERAQRNIEVAADGIKGALASAFADPLGDAADWIAANRGPVLQFFLDLANGALDFGDSLVEGLAAGTEGVGQFVAGPLADLTKGLAGFVGFFDKDAGEGLDELAAGMRDFDDQTNLAADSMRETLGGALDQARQKLNEFAEPQVALGFLNDASLRLATAIDGVGVAADGGRLALDGIDLANLRSSESGAQLEDQVRGSIAALSDQINAARDAGESQANLKDRYDSATTALVGQLTQMGLTEEQARTLIDTVLQTPTSATTEFGSNAEAEQQKVQNLAGSITTLPDGTVSIDVNTWPAQNGVDEFIRQTNGRVVRLNVETDSLYIPGTARGYHGGVVDFMARGGIPDLVPMDRVAQMVNPNTWRVVGDRGDVPEAFVPLDGSPRSWSILMEALRRMPGSAASGGGSTAVTESSGAAPIQVIHNGDNYAFDPRDIAREEREQLTRALDALPTR